MPIHVNYLTRDQLDVFAPEDAAKLLCIIGYGAPCPDWVPIGCPFSQLAMKSLTSVEYEVWTATGQVRYDAARGFAVARTPGLMMALIEPDQLGTQLLDDVARQAYARVFDLTDGAECSLVRIWNYIPGIIDDEADIERYKRFNVGRAEAFRDSHGAPAVPPAASALGTAEGDMLIYFLAAEGSSVAIENPRQISAYHYPEQYGPASPNFSRATLAKMGTSSMLFVSGTASIVGHESMHIGDVAAQTHETIRNLRAVWAEAAKNGFSFDAGRTRLKIYLRDPEHLDAVQAIVQAEIPGVAATMVLNADICRRELLLEIEAVCAGR